MAYKKEGYKTLYGDSGEDPLRKMWISDLTKRRARRIIKESINFKGPLDRLQRSEIVIEVYKQFILKEFPINPDKLTIILTYVPFKYEPDITELNLFLFNQGYTLCVPQMNLETNKIELCLFDPTKNTQILSNGYILQLHKLPKLLSNDKISVALIPCLAIIRTKESEKCIRLGYGKGHFDELFLNNSQLKETLKIGLSLSQTLNPDPSSSISKEIREEDLYIDINVNYSMNPKFYLIESDTELDEKQVLPQTSREKAHFMCNNPYLNAPARTKFYIQEIYKLLKIAKEK